MGRYKFRMLSDIRLAFPVLAVNQGEIEQDWHQFQPFIRRGCDQRVHIRKNIVIKGEFARRRRSRQTRPEIAEDKHAHEGGATVLQAVQVGRQVVEVGAVAGMVTSPGIGPDIPAILVCGRRHPREIRPRPLRKSEPRRCAGICEQGLRSRTQGWISSNGFVQRVFTRPVQATRGIVAEGVEPGVQGRLYPMDTNQVPVLIIEDTFHRAAQHRHEAQ